MDSPKKAELSKAVLNVTIFKEHPDNDFIGVSQPAVIDITEALNEAGVDSIAQINGVSMTSEEELPAWTRIVIDAQELNNLGADIFGIIDAAIVNEKQGKAVKKLVQSKFDAFLTKHFNPIRKSGL
jgi:acyl-CoA synthetase (NDP forming)